MRGEVPMTKKLDGLLAFADAEAFARWLGENAGAKEAWLKFAKKGGGAQTLSKSEAIDCALCFGWIDGRLERLDDAYFLTRFTPRKPGGRWSEINRERAEALISAGRMQPRGLAEVAAAKADGRWAAAYASASAIATPADFAAALQANERAAEAFAALDGANRYAVLYRLHHARTRERAVADMIARLERGELFHQAPQRGGSKTKRGEAGNSTPS